MKRNVYLKTKDIEYAVREYIEQSNVQLQTEMIPVQDGLNRITAAPVIAQVSSPFYNASAMDGIALNAYKTYGVTEQNPVQLKQDTDFIYINTGDPIPERFDAVVMIEDVETIDEFTIKLYESVVPFQHIRTVGEDITVNDVIIDSYKKLKPIDIAGMIAAGVETIEVLQKLSFGIIPTGSEIVKSKEELEVGKIIDSNSYLLLNSIKEMGHSGFIYPVVKDVSNDIKEALEQSVSEHDVTLIIAGSSAGSKDYNKSVIEEAGRVLTHGVAIKPGKPVILGEVDQKMVFGIPGFPVSAYVVIHEIIQQILASMYHQKISKNVIQARLKSTIHSSLKHKEYIRVAIQYLNNEYIASPLNRGAGNQKSVIDADGILVIPKASEGYYADQIVEVELLQSTEEIQSRLYVMGSHDLSLNMIHNKMLESGVGLKSNHVGSMGGIYALIQKECMIAPIHLLDLNTNTYNEAQVKQYFDEEMILIKGIKRNQVLLLQKGNPKNITSLEQITQKNVLYANRQKGAGTRVLLDSILQANGIDKESINGYHTQFQNHIHVGMSVKSGNADCGLAIEAIAHIFDLDYIDVAQEEYDFLTYKSHLNHPKIQLFLETLQSKQFQTKLNNTAGYSLDKVVIKDVR